LTHGAGSTALITAGSAEWILLSVVYHYVLTQSPSPEAAKITILTAWANGQLRLRAEVREHRARTNLKPTSSSLKFSQSGSPISRSLRATN
jgi:hypothetical protein